MSGRYFLRGSLEEKRGYGLDYDVCIVLSILYSPRKGWAVRFVCLLFSISNPPSALVKAVFILHYNINISILSIQDSKSNCNI